MSDHYLRPRYNAGLVQRAVQLHQQLIRTTHLPTARRGHGTLGKILFRLACPDSTRWIPLADDLAAAARTGETLRVWAPAHDPRLAALPWEYLRVPPNALGDFKRIGVQLGSPFLALHPNCVIVRDETGARRVKWRPLDRLRVLAVWANPGGVWPALDSFAAEAGRVERGLGQPPDAFVEVRVLPRARVQDILKAVAEYQPDVIHFSGHGHHPDFSTTPGAPPVPALVCGKTGRPEYLTADRLAAACQKLKVPPAAIVLNCCFAGFSRPGMPSFAQELVAGITPAPVVVAYQTPATDSAAAGLAVGLYEGLRDKPVEEAVAAYRCRLAAGHGLGDGTPEWGVPVVHLPHPGGVRLYERTPYPLGFESILAGYGALIGRAGLKNQIREFRDGLALRREGGLFLLEGEPGVGKTALLWDIVGAAPEETPHFFYRREAATRNTDECLRSLYVAVQRGLPGHEAPRHSGVGLEDLLRRAGERALAEGTVLHVVIDGLDEAPDGPQFGVLDSIPLPVPAGVCMVASARPCAALDELKRKGVEPVKLLPGSAEHMEDARAACEMFLGDACPSALYGSGGRARDLAAAMAERAGGNFLVLTCFFRAHHGPGYTFDQLEAAARDLTPYPHEYYERFFESLPNDRALEHVHTVLAAMATAHGR